MGLDLKINWTDFWNSLAKGIELGFKNVKDSLIQFVADLVFYLKLAGIVSLILIIIYLIAKIGSCVFTIFRVCRGCCSRSTTVSNSKIARLRIKSRFLRRLKKRQGIRKTSLA